MNVLYVVPARGGSKGIPKKNLVSLGGRTLIWWTIYAACKACVPGRIVVSTDDPEIRDVALSAGVEAPFLRPECLSTDQAATVDVLNHALIYYENQLDFTADLVVCLQPTSPLRRSQDIDAALDICRQHVGDSVVSVTQVKEHPCLLRVIRDDAVQFYDRAGADALRRQDFSPVYVLNGAIYITPREYIINGQMLAPIVRPYIMERNVSVDIDAYEDLAYAELLLSGNAPQTAELSLGVVS